MNHGSEPESTNTQALKLAHLNTVTMNVIINYICAFPARTAANVGLGYEIVLQNYVVSIKFYDE